MSSPQVGFIKISRKMFDGMDVLWEGTEPFDKRSAWIDLIQMAAWHPYLYKGRDQLQRGEFVASIRFLAQRWKWPKSTVLDYLNMLKKAGHISGQRSGHFGTVYLLAKYDSYQSTPSPVRTLDGTPDRTESGQIKGSKEELLTTTSHAADAASGADEAPDGAAAPLAKPARKKKPATPSSFRLAPYIDAARAIVGESDPPGARWGRLFRRLEQKYGRDETLTRWENMLRTKKDWALRAPEDLATNWGKWGNDPDDDLFRGENGWMLNRPDAGVAP